MPVANSGQVEERWFNFNGDCVLHRTVTAVISTIFLKIDFFQSFDIKCGASLGERPDKAIRHYLASNFEN